LKSKQFSNLKKKRETKVKYRRNKIKENEKRKSTATELDRPIIQKLKQSMRCARICAAHGQRIGLRCNRLA
jgi:hypothetical protein